jgi:CxxC-x17-CxxC domain-containing protein
MKSFVKKQKFGKKSFSRAGRRNRFEGTGPGREDRPKRKPFAPSDDRSKRFETGFESTVTRRDGGFRTELFKVPCARCGKTATVPFKPMGSKPILCKECFGDKNASTPRENGFGRRRGPDDRFTGRPRPAPSSDTLDLINQKLDKIMRALKID